MSIRGGARIAAAVAIAVVLSLLILRQVSSAHVARQIAGAPPGLLLAAGGGALGFNLARALRYRILLGPVATPRGPLMFAVSTTAWGVSLVLPGVVGDGFLIWLLGQVAPVSVTRGGAAVLLSRAADVSGFVLVVLLVGPLVGVALPARAAAAILGLGAFVSILALTLLWRRPRRQLLKLAARVPWIGRAASAVDVDLSTMTGRPQLAGMLAATALARLCSAVEYTALFAAVGAGLGPLQVLFAVSARTLLFAIPIQGVAGLGTTQLWWTASLVLLGWKAIDALSVSVAVHVLDLAVSVPVVLLGVATLAWHSRGQTEAPMGWQPW